ncbi:9021_t:CDS:2, partial [Racocetra fulgida]
MQCVSHCDGRDPSKREYFEQPVWQTLNMFVGETMCFVVAYVLLRWEVSQKKKSNEPLEVETTLTNDSETIVESEPVSPPIKIDDHYRGPMEELSAPIDSISDLELPVETNDNSIEAMVGVFFVVFAQLFTAAQFVLEEKIMEKYRVKPVLAVGLEGLF